MLTDTFLEEVAKFLNNESATVVSHLTFSSDAITPDATDTSVSGELGTRISVSNSRSSSVPTVTFTGTRSGAVASSSGDFVNLAALFTASSGGNLMAEAIVPSVLHTTDFDLEVDWSITAARR